MNFFDYAIITILLITLIYVILYLYRKRGSGCAGCSGCTKSNVPAGCERCPGNQKYKRK